jgi:hypothetical protein
MKRLANPEVPPHAPTPAVVDVAAVRLLLMAWAG